MNRSNYFLFFILILTTVLFGCQKDEGSDIAKNIVGTYDGRMRMYYDNDIKFSATSTITRRSKSMITINCVFSSYNWTIDSIEVTSSEADIYELKYIGHKLINSSVNFSGQVKGSYLYWWITSSSVPFDFYGSKKIE
jgi:hypothetical protein